MVEAVDDEIGRIAYAVVAVGSGDARDHGRGYFASVIVGECNRSCCENGETFRFDFHQFRPPSAEF